MTHELTTLSDKVVSAFELLSRCDHYGIRESFFSLLDRVLNVVSSWVTCSASLISGLQLAVYSATKLAQCAEQWKNIASG